MNSFRSIGIACLLFPLLLFAQPRALVRPLSPIALNVDVTQFRCSETENYIEMTYGLFPSVLTLVQKDTLFEGGMEIRANIRKKENDSLVFAYPRLFPVQTTDTTEASLSKVFLSKFTIRLPFGKYNLSIHYIDAVNRLRADSLLYDLVITSFSDSTAMSDIDLCSHITESDQKESPFYKNTYETYTNPSHFFGTSFAPVLYSYVELYNLHPGNTYILTQRLLDWKGTVVKEQTKKRIPTASAIVDVGTMKVVQFPSGKYFFVMELRDSAGNSKALRQKTIFLHNPGVQATTTEQSKLLAFGAAYAGMSEEELDKEFNAARYICRKEDEKIFSKLSTPEAKREFLSQFWGEVESGKRGFTDVTRAVYVDRVTIANQRYRQFGKEGWRTDRGRIYILYGEPSDIERYPMSDNAKPYEIWQYDHIEGGVKFIFVDRSGYGEYILVHSTKRGEIQDENWQRYLQ